MVLFFAVHLHLVVKHARLQLVPGLVCGGNQSIKFSWCWNSFPPIVILMRSANQQKLVDALGIRRIYADLTERMHHFNQHHTPHFTNGDIVEMDETMMEWSEGDLRGHWVICAISRETGQCWLEVLEERTKASMQPLINRVIKAGTIVITDALSSYSGILHELNTTHKVINKQREGFARTDAAT